MGSRRVSRLTEDEIVQRYRDGQSKSLIALKAGLPDHLIEAVLRAAGCRLRGRAEALRLALQTRPQWSSTQRMRSRLGRGHV